ncbi:MAG: hypothetical protein GY749_38520 [Desulfobacteraceae bacterium]|nr:hypothetical protein [Desulfobacteraceae bacterium]
MNKFYFYCDQLGPAQALKLLSETVDKIAEPYLGEVCVQIPTNKFDYISIVVPDVMTEKGTKKEKQARKQAFDVLINKYHLATNGRMPRRSQIAGDFMPLSKGIFQILLNSECASGDQQAKAAQDEFLVIGHKLDKKRALAVFEEIRFQATSLRIAAKKSKMGVLYLFHVLDDQDRLSSFQSAVVGNAFSDCHILNGFVSNGGRVFLHPDLNPEKKALDSFCRILKKAPRVFNMETAISGDSLMVAIDHRPVDEGIKDKTASRFLFFNLSGVSFSSQAEFTPGVSHYADFEFHDLSRTSDALENLRYAMEEAEPYIGYRLELRSTRHLESAEKERDLLQEELINLEYKLAYLDSIAQPRPVLLRFTQAQLHMLADVLRSYPQQVIQSGNIEYGFQATEHNPEGLHYLLVDPALAVKNETDPLLWWLNPGGQAVQFRLDPFWAPYYHGPDNKYLLFVPDGATLSPPMHDWDQESMDTYLRDIMKTWYHGEHGVPVIPGKPIYIFEGDTGSDADIHISILDRAQFQPLRERLGWLNDNLDIIQAVEKEELVREIAQDITGRRLAEYFRGKAADAEAAFEAAAQEAGNRIASKLDEMTEILTEEISRLVNEVQKTTGEILDLRRELEDYTGVHYEMKQELKQAEDRKNEIEKNKEGFYKEMVRLENMVLKPVLSAAEKTREKVEQEVSAEIDRLQDIRNKLRKKLFKL